MKEELKVYIVGGKVYNHYVNWLPNVKIVDTIEECDLVLFAGGEDVNPKYYNEPKHSTTHFNDQRDIEEIEIYKKAKELDKKCLGVCRGSQLLCVMSNGKLVQHQENNSYLHKMETNEVGNVMVTSTHHQAQFPFDLPKEEYRILGWTRNLSSFHKDGNNNEMNPSVECEVVYYPKTKCLGIQSHPEECYPPNDDSEREMIHIMQHYVKKLMNDFKEEPIRKSRFQNGGVAQFIELNNNNIANIIANEL